MVHPIQVRQAREAGPSAILIIVRALTDEEIRGAAARRHRRRLDALYEIHSYEDCSAPCSTRRGSSAVNNRDLAVFQTTSRSASGSSRISRKMSSRQRERHRHGRRTRRAPGPGVARRAGRRGAHARR